MPEIIHADPSDPPIHSSVCRSLNFGKCRRKDADEESFLRKEFESIRKSDSAKWNFDFYNEKPLKGQYEWRRVTRSQRKVIDCCHLPFGDHS